MSMELPKGLVKFPITKICMCTTVLVPLLASIAGMKFWFLLQYDPFIMQYNQYYRYFIFQMSCVNESDMMLITLIWYHFRNLERLLGSIKYLNLISLTFIYTTLVLTIFNWMLNIFISIGLINGLPSGGLPIILSLYHFYKEFTPEIYEYQMLLWKPNFFRIAKSSANGKIMLTLNDHFLLDSLIWLLLLNQGFVGVFYGFISWLIGVSISKHLLPGLDRWKIPFIEKLMMGPHKAFSSVNEPLLSNAEVLAESTIENENATSNNIDIVGNNIQNSNNNPMDGHESNNNTNETLETDDEPVRPLGVQFLDTFRR